jgi:hypothetical protein
VPPIDAAKILNLDRPEDGDDHSFRRVVQEIGLTGIKFTPVWSSKGGPIRRTIDWFNLPDWK